jgi:hypothetical protein
MCVLSAKKKAEGTKGTAGGQDGEEGLPEGQTPEQKPWRPQHNKPCYCQLEMELGRL